MVLEYRENWVNSGISVIFMLIIVRFFLFVIVWLVCVFVDKIFLSKSNKME